MDVKDEVKDRLQIEDVVGDYIELKKSGRNFKGLSPFSKEKTPSLMVSPEKQIWHDFSSNQGGDMLSFVMLMEGVDFRTALELLARKAGIDMSLFKGRSGTHAKKKERIYSALELAIRYYQTSLTKNREALDYLVKKRGYGKQIISDFRLGYAPRSPNALQLFMSKRGYSTQELKDAGLVSIRSGSSSRDMFRGRIMVPLFDGQGKPVGFTARVLDNGLPKYINTPQTLVYDKSRHVFGLRLAKESMRNLGYVVVVEGNMDVVGSHKSSVKNVIATAGTAMTMDQLKQVYRIADDVRLAYDQDRAGLQATERAIPIAQELGARLSIITLSHGKDPDELIAKDPKLWEQCVEDSQYVMDWLIGRYKTQFDLESAEGKRKFTDKVLSVLANVKDPVEQEHYLKLVSELTDSSLPVLSKKLVSFGTVDKPKLKPNKAKVVAKTNPKNTAYQDLLLGLSLAYPDTQRSLKDIESNFFATDTSVRLASYILDKAQAVSTIQAVKDLQDIENYVKLVLFKTEELYSDWSSSDRTIEAIGLARRLKQDNQTFLKKKLIQQIRQAEQTGDVKTQQELVAKFGSLLKEQK